MQEHSLYCYLERQSWDLLETILYGYIKSVKEQESENLVRMVLEICNKKGYIDHDCVRKWEEQIEKEKRFLEMR